MSDAEIQRRRIYRLRFAIAEAIKSMDECRNHAQHHDAKVKLIAILRKDRKLYPSAGRNVPIEAAQTGGGTDKENK